MTTIGGLVLCGGRSTRMGQSKALLPFGPERMLQRVVRILGSVVDPVVVVAAAGQELPELPPGVRIARDEHESLGPLAGLLAGLKALPDGIDAVYVSAVDSPLLRPEFVRRMVAALGEHEAAVPRDGRFHHPLAAVYRVRLLPIVAELLATEQLRPLFLLQRADTVEIDVTELRSVDPELDSLRNTNTPEDYAAALRSAGFGN